MKLFRELSITTVIRAKAAGALILLGIGVSVLMYSPFLRYLRTSS